MVLAEKQNLVLLPGLLCDERLYRAQIDDLADIARCSVADLTVADSITELAAEVLKHSPPRFALAGLSMGGYVAFEIMRQAPERVQALALLSTTARPDTAEATANRHAAMAQAKINFQIVLDQLMPKLVHPTRMKYHSMVDSIYSMGHRIGEEAYLRQQRAIIGRIDSRPYLAAIKCPTLVLCGRDDVVTPVAVHEEMAAAIPGAQLTVLEECAHLSTMGQPAEVSAALRGWLGRAG
ncbi:MAG: alpha/beta fold hydrolase [Betaproteobacteria bacterium]|nr:alpha/beta fold hydrolase [Betaproteobacteria bacterium]